MGDVVSEARCELSDLPVTQCGCRIHAPSPPAPRDQDEDGPRPFRAQFHGWCSGCGVAIEPGDLIVSADGYLHEGCA